MKDILRIKTISQIHDFLNLEKPGHPLVSVVRHNDQWESIDMKKNRYVMELYQISLKNFKSSSFLYGRNTYDFQEGTMVFTGPGQVMEFNRNKELVSADNPGWTLLFHPDLIRKSELGRTIEQYTYFDYDTNEALHLSDLEKKTLAEIVDKIATEYNQNIDKHSQELIIANIEILLKYCKRYYDRQFYTRTNLNKDLLSNFNKVIKDYYRSDRPFRNGVLTVKECANELNMSVNYLGDLIKNETGTNAKDHIQDYIVEKAKTRLLGTNESISHIAFGLGFEYPQGFNKLFKAKVGASPSEYRNWN